MSRDNVAIVQGIYAAYGRGDLAGALGKMATEIEVVQSEELPWGGTFRGHEGVRRFFDLLREHLEGTGLPMERFLDAGDHVVAIGRTQGRVRGTGKVFDVPLAHVWEVRGGRAVGFRPFIDHEAMFAALGK